MAVIVLGACDKGAASTAPGASVASPRPPARETSPPPTPPVPDPWLAYLTYVDPGSAIRFATVDVGWRVEGQSPTPHLDMRWGTGLGDNGWGWPGSGVATSVDGGRSWRPILRKGDGVWGIDLLSADVGWVVGVTSLSRTLDGGASWQTMGEPTGKPLVTVHFVSRSVGYGLTTDGRLAHTSDGGASWTRSALHARGTALCFTSARDGYVSDEAGDVYATHDGGETWRKAADSPVSDLAPVWSELSCGAGEVWQTVTAEDIKGHVEGWGYLLRHSRDRGAAWSTLGGFSTGPGYSPDPNVPVSGRTFDVADLDVMTASTGGRATVAGAPLSSSTPGRPAADETRLAVLTVAPGRRPGTATVASLPHGGGSLQHAPRAVVHGASFVGSTGWLFLDDGALGSPNAREYTSIVLKSTDDGASWRVACQSPLTPMS